MRRRRALALAVRDGRRAQEELGVLQDMRAVMTQLQESHNYLTRNNDRLLAELDTLKKRHAQVRDEDAGNVGSHAERMASVGWLTPDMSPCRSWNSASGITTSCPVPSASLCCGSEIAIIRHVRNRT